MVNKKHLNSWPLYPAKVTHTWLLQFINRSQALHFAKKYSLQISSKNWSNVHGSLLKSSGFYRFFPNSNVISFYFHFLQGMLSHPLCYLKLALFKARKSWIFKIFYLRSMLKVMPWISQFLNQVHYREFQRE